MPRVTRERLAVVRLASNVVDAPVFGPPLNNGVALRRHLRIRNKPMSNLLELATVSSLRDAPKGVAMAVLSIATLLLVLAVVGTVRARRSSEVVERRAAPVLALTAIALTYFHPVTQEFLNTLYLAPKLERARALAGQSLEQLFDDLGEPSMVVPDPSPSPQSYGYALLQRIEFAGSAGDARTAATARQPHGGFRSVRSTCALPTRRTRRCKRT